MKGLERVMPEKVGIRSSAILEFLDDVKRNALELHGIAIVKNGKLAAEGYAYPYRAGCPHAMFSFTKSLTATAIGFLVQEGKVSLTEKLTEIFADCMPETISANLAKADIYSLLTMSCGHETEISWDCDAHWLKTFFAHEFRYEPGTMFQYNTMGTNVLAAVIRRKTGQNMTEYLRTRLFEPLQMGPVTCSLMPDGTEAGGVGAQLTLEDMTRFTLFYLNRGRWEGKQLLNEAWFDLASAKQIETVNPVFTNHDSNWREGYGFQFWRCVPEGIYRADGAYGQFGIAIPEYDTAVVIQSVSSDPDLLLNLLWKNLLPGLSKETLPDEPRLAKHLWHRLCHLSLPTPFGVRNRKSERSVNGAIYECKAQVSFDSLAGGAGVFLKNPAGIRSLSFAFEDDAVRIRITDEMGAFDVNAGLDGRFHDSAIRGKLFAAAARWEDADTLQVEIRNLNAASGGRLFFTFEGDSLKIVQKHTLPQGPGLGEKQTENMILYKENSNV